MYGKWYLVVISAALAISLAFVRDASFHFISICTFACYLIWRKEHYRVLLVVIVAFVGFFSYAVIYDRANESALTENEAYFSGKIMTIPLIDGDRLSFQLQVESGESIQVSYRIESEREQKLLMNLKVRMICQLQGTLEAPSPATNFYNFDYRAYLYKQNIHWIVTPQFASFSTCEQHALSLYERLLLLRQTGILYVQQHFPESIAGIVNALVFGERSFVDEELLYAYQRLGVIHLLAISGLHVGLVVGGLFYLLLRLGMTREKVYTLLLICLPIYAIVTGAAPPIVRASAMTFIFLLSLRFKWRSHPLDGISAIALIMLVYKPYFISELGFQLSFLISYVLLLSSENIVARYPNYVQQLLAITILSQLSALPLLLYHFYEFSLLSFPLNLLFIPLISFVVLPLSIVSVLLALISQRISSLTWTVIEAVVSRLHDVLLVVENSDVASFVFGQPSKEFVFFFMLLLFACYYLWEAAQIKRFMYVASFIVILLVAQMFSSSFTKFAQVTMLDVGQGDSFLIELPYRRKVYLIDTGGYVQFGEKESWQERRRTFDLGKDVILKTLKGKGIRKIDKLILTHGDYDHIGATDSLLGNIKIAAVFYGRGPIEKEFEKQLLETIHSENIPLYFVKEGMNWRVKNDRFYILSPSGEEVATNERSIVLYAIINGVRFLFVGDLEKEGEQRLIEQYPHVRADILKVGHHGSRTSTSAQFLEHLKPKIALISAGKNNRYHHPHEEVLQELTERNIQIFRSDEHGATSLQFTNNRLKIETKLQ